MEQWDEVKSIFLEKISCKETIKKAILFESQKNWIDAQTEYKKLLDTDISNEKKDFYYDSYFKCFAHLGEWHNLPKAIKIIVSSDSQTDFWENLWDRDWNQQKLLPWYINSQVKSVLFEQKCPNEFLININKYLNDPETAYYLKNHFSEELCMLWMFKGNIDVAKLYMDNYIDGFLDNWQLLDPKFFTLCYNKILKLRNIIDIYKFIEVYDHLDADCENDLKNLQKYWNKTSNEVLPSILLNETRMLYRKQFIKLLIDKLKSFNDDDCDHIIKNFKETELKFYIDMINSSSVERNYYLAKTYYKECHNISCSNPELNAKLQLSIGMVAHLKCEMTSDSSEKYLIMFEALKILNRITKESKNLDFQFSTHLQLFNIYKNITEILEDANLFNSKKDELAIIIENTPQFARDIASFGANNLKLFIQKYEAFLDERMITDDEMVNRKERETIAKAYDELALFVKGKTDCVGNFISFTLRAMKLNSLKARQMFPCILMEKELSDRHKTLFLEETKNIPTWMFLGWIPQLLVNIDSPNISVVAPIILRIAETYPQSIMYAYRLSKENYNFSNASIETEIQSLTAKLDNLLLSDEKVDFFLKALSTVSMPAITLKYYITKLWKACSSGVNEAKMAHKMLLEEVYKTSRVNRPFQNSFIEKQIGEFKSSLQNMKFKNNQLDKVMDELVIILRKLKLIIENQKIKPPLLLKDYCLWLANFSAHNLNYDLEIPGQYDGSKLPLIQHHVKISAFCPNVSVMESLRSPIKITILGNDTKEYPFLIKFGEDIRQDQRIEQLFSLMNNIFQNDCECNQRDLNLLTYQVIPLTTNLGMIQWIDQTKSLQKFIESSFKSSETDFIRNINHEYFGWISSACSKNSINIDIFGKAAMTFSKNKVISYYHSLINKIPLDVIKRGFWNLSANTESFIALRNNFIKSYAVICASHWILGIGDRHLSNSLICIKSGKVLGIDFGHAFGTATQIIPVPELVPFRLTPHIINLMEPLGVNGLFRETMIHCLNSLRTNRTSLLATMNVFIEEPSIDWLEYASSDSSGSSSSNHDWYPSQKIDQAKRKLEGAKSTTIMIEELEAGQKKYFEAYATLVKGEESDLRANFDDGNLSVEDQVDCLIDHATDYNLLGRMYSGWSSWM